jgi:hypothetical protein
MQPEPKQRDLLGLLDGCQGCLTSLGLFLLFLAIGAGPSLWGWSILRNARASAAWPTAEGIVTRSEVTHSTDADGDDTYRPEVTYEYSVQNRSYENYTIKFGENSYSSQRQAEEIGARYPLGRQVAVYYDPADPGRSVLEPGVSGGSYIVLGVGVLFVAVALVTAPLAFIFRSRN